ncbi:hypothetical protein, partial [Streptomyces sp. SID161]|uniref:hypothetical protein n=1 Tax=Streptomyces sp. SID161 TaxID=2690251 RepID=UPI001F266C00
GGRADGRTAAPVDSPGLFVPPGLPVPPGSFVPPGLFATVRSRPSTHRKTVFAGPWFRFLTAFFAPTPAAAQR